MRPGRFGIIALAGALFLMAPRPALAHQGDTSGDAGQGDHVAYGWTLQIDPLTTALGYAHIQVERRLSDKWSLYAGPHFRLFDGLLHEDDEPSFRGYGGELGLRYFFRGGAPGGWWGQVRGVLARVEGDGETSPGGYISALAGHTWILGQRWVLAGGLGVQYIDYGVGEAGIQSAFPAAHTTFGVAF